MTQELPEDHITRKTVVYRIKGMDQVAVRRDLEYQAGAAGSLTMDLYSLPDATKDELGPAVISVAGYPDPGVERMFGRRFKEWGSSTSWGRLLAASGLVAVNYSNREPAADIHSLLRHLRENGAALGIDAKRIGLLASSGHGPLALSVLMDDQGEAPLRCAALLCPFTMDVDGFTAVADAARTFRFATPATGKSVDDLPPNAALFIARAGRDQMPGLNETLDRFLAKALGGNLPLTLVNHAEALHAFDLTHDSGTSREIIRGAVEFLRFHLLAE